MTLSKHALRRLNERIGIPPDEFVPRVMTQSVLERVEKTGERHLIMFVPEVNETFCIVEEDDTIITLMPLIWRAKQVSDEVLDEARRLAL